MACLCGQVWDFNTHRLNPTVVGAMVVATFISFFDITVESFGSRRRFFFKLFPDRGRAETRPRLGEHGVSGQRQTGFLPGDCARSVHTICVVICVVTGPSLPVSKHLTPCR